MGDMADYYFDLALANGENPFYQPLRTYRQPITPSPPPKCRVCGEVCYWAKRSGKWILMDSGKPHECRPSALEEKALKGFTG